MTVLFDEGRFKTIDDWCKKESWNYVHFRDIRGSECDVIVMYDIDCNEVEPYSRAKNGLIIVNGYISWFR